MSSKKDKKFCERLTHARKEAGYTQKDLAKRLGVTEQTANKYERGVRTPDAQILIRWVELTQCDPTWLVTGHQITAVQTSAPSYKARPRIADKLTTEVDMAHFIKDPLGAIAKVGGNDGTDRAMGALLKIYGEYLEHGKLAAKLLGGTRKSNGE